MLTTNLLVACLGVAFIAFGVIGFRDGFKGAILFPPLIFKRNTGQQLHAWKRSLKQQPL